MGRSPSYPALSVDQSVERARILYERWGRSPASAEEIVKAWGHNRLHGSSRRELSALRQYGLLESASSGDRLSATAIKLVTAPQSSPEWSAALERTVDEPTIFSEINSFYPDDLPTDGILEGDLVGSMGFSRDGAKKCIAVLRANIEYLENVWRERRATAEPMETGAERDATPTPENTAQPLDITKKRKDGGQMVFTTPLVTSGATLTITGEVDEAELELLKGWLTYVQGVLSSRVDRAKMAGQPDAKSGEGDDTRREDE